MEEIYELLLSTIGLSFKNGRLYDDDKGAYLLFKGGKHIVKPDYQILRDKSVVVFDPLMNKALMAYLFQVYIDKETEDGNLYLTSFQVVFENNQKDRTDLTRRKLLMIVGNGIQVETRYYYIESLAYMEAVFIATGMNLHQIPDLEKFDDKELLIVEK